MKSADMGCQGVIEGLVAAKDGCQVTVVKKPDGKLVIDVKKNQTDREAALPFRIPLLRGIAVFCQRIIWGVKNLWYSSSVSDEEAEEEGKGRSEKIAVEALKQEKTAKGFHEMMMGVMLFVIFVVFAGLFMMLPYFLSTFFGKYIASPTIYRFLENGIRLAIFIAMALAASRLSVIRRILQYQGAGHQLMNCLAEGREPTAAHLKRSSLWYRQSNSSFLLYVFLVSITLFMFVQIESAWLRVIVRLCVIPVVAGVLYEVGLFAKSCRHPLAVPLHGLRMLLQSAVVIAPEEDMVLLAVRAGEILLEEAGGAAGTDGAAADQESTASEWSRTAEDTAEAGNAATDQKNTAPEWSRTAGEDAEEEVLELGSAADDPGEDAPQEAPPDNVVDFFASRHKVLKSGPRGKAPSRKLPDVVDTLEEREKEERWREQKAEFGDDEDDDDEILIALDRYFDEKE